MRTKTWIGYSLVLLLAFAMGLVGTIAVSHALVSSARSRPGAPHTQQNQDIPASTPAAPSSPTVEC